MMTGLENIIVEEVIDKWWIRANNMEFNYQINWYIVEKSVIDL